MSANYLKPLGGAGWYRLDSPAASTAALIAALSADASVAKVEPDYVGRPEIVRIARPVALYRRPMFDLPNDPLYPLQWAFENTGQDVGGISGTPGADINAPAAWTIATGSGQVVLVDFDTGIDFNNPDLAPNVWSAPQAYAITEGGNLYNCPQGSHGFSAIDYYSGCDGQESDNDTVDPGHGTYMAGDMGAASNNGLGIAGTNWDVSMLSIVICYDQSCPELTAVTGIDAAMQIATRFNLNIVAGNMSHGNLGGSALEDEMALAGQNGILFAASTGDEGYTTADQPASFYLSNEIAVAASDQFDHLSQWGCCAATNSGGNIAAPGTNIYTTVRGDNGNNPVAVDGTSPATAIVTGALGLLAAACPKLAHQELIPTIEGTADPIPALDTVATDGHRLDLGNAVESCAEAGHTAGTGTVTVYLPGPTPDHSGTMTVTLLGVDYSYSYDTAVDDTDSVGEALAGQLGSYYVNAVYEGNGAISLTTTAAGPYTGYPLSTSVQDTCNNQLRPQSLGGGGCNPAPRISSTGIVPGN